MIYIVSNIFSLNISSIYIKFKCLYPNTICISQCTRASVYYVLISFSARGFVGHLDQAACAVREPAAIAEV